MMAMNGLPKHIVLGVDMNNYEKHAWQEFKAAGWLNEDGVTFNDEMQEMICKHVLKLIDMFADEGHSGSSAPYAIALFKRIAMFEPVSPLTGEDWEWTDVGSYGSGIQWQNKRMGSVFKDGDGKPYWMDGKVFWEWFKCDDGTIIKSHYTSRDSRVYIEFPWVKPENPEYVFVPTEEFPNEVL